MFDPTYRPAGVAGIVEDAGGPPAGTADHRKLYDAVVSDVCAVVVSSPLSLEFQLKACCGAVVELLTRAVDATDDGVLPPDIWDIAARTAHILASTATRCGGKDVAAGHVPPRLQPFIPRRGVAKAWGAA